MTSVSSISYNAEGVFACSTDSGVGIFNMEPFAEIKNLDKSLVGSVAICEMLGRTNILAIVRSNGILERFAQHAVLLWDDADKKLIAEFQFSSNVLSVKLRKDRLFVVEENMIHIFIIPDNPTKLSTLQTGPNPRGLLEITICSSSQHQLLVSPGLFKGKIQLFGIENVTLIVIALYIRCRRISGAGTGMDLTKISADSTTLPNVIDAHVNEIACLAISDRGTLVATGSTRGTLIRVFDTKKKVLLTEFRRGSGAASLHCINFSSSSKFLCASSENGTVHIFAVKERHLNKTLPFSGMTKWLNVKTYVDSSWALATFKVPEDRECVCVFGGDSTVYAICTDGTLRKYISSSKGKFRMESIHEFFKSVVDWPSI